MFWVIVLLCGSITFCNDHVSLTLLKIKEVRENGRRVILMDKFYRYNPYGHVVERSTLRPIIKYIFTVDIILKPSVKKDMDKGSGS